ncbi:MAG TPA: c-type cytochrome [Saprospiraceae bacterium]|nr:c-type cytochrome [Saprospiraceae bacterium]HMQ82673.1 c-type cytochrome [Saprospiraceae bacterium]
MKKVFKSLGIAIGVIVLALLILLAYAYLTPMKRFPVQDISVQLPVDSMNLAQGKKLVETVCAHCHLGEDGKLSGRLFNRKEDPFGEMWSANITQHENGIKNYSNGELAYLMRTGVNREGRYVGNMMCHPQMSDEMLASIIAYLRSDADIVKASATQHPAPAYLNSPLIKIFAILGMFKPLPYDGQPIQAPPMTDKVAYGRYLATDVYECGVCHSQNFEMYNYFQPEESARFFGGGCPVPDENFEKVLSPNLTPSKEFGIGSWTEQEFMDAVKGGIKKDGNILQPQMPRFAQLSDEEVSAIWAYLKTIPTIESELTEPSN